MPIRKPKPTSPGRRFVTYADFGDSRNASVLWTAPSAPGAT